MGENDPVQELAEDEGFQLAAQMAEDGFVAALGREAKAFDTVECELMAALRRSFESRLRAFLAERDGEVAAMRGALEVLSDDDCERDDGIECIRFEPYSTEYCAICKGKAALATGAGEREAAVLRAARVLFEAEHRCSVVGAGIDMDAEYSATSVPGAYRALLDAAGVLWGGEGEG
jgi:hypothetical protein